MLSIRVQHVNRWFFLSFLHFFSHCHYTCEKKNKHFFLGNIRFTKFKLQNFSSNVSMQNRSGSKIETKSQLMALQATLAEKGSTKGESEDNDDW